MLMMVLRADNVIMVMRVVRTDNIGGVDDGCFI